MNVKSNGNEETRRPDGESADEEEEIVAQAVIVPPDGGWGWVIVAASFLTNTVVDGIIFTTGQGFLPIWEKEFTAGSAAMAAWVVSLLSGCYLLVGPIVSAVANIFGCRITAIIGAIMASLGFLLSMFASNIWFLYLSFGVLGGVGLGFVYLPSIVIVSYYFEKKRALATGIAVCGSGIGTFVFAPLIRFLLSVFTWNKTILILSGIILLCIIFAMFYRKLEPTKQQMDKVNEKLLEYDEEQERKMTAAKRSAVRPVSYHQPIAEKAPENGLLDTKVEFERFLTDENGRRDTETGIKHRAISVGQRAFRSTMDLSVYRKQTHPSSGRQGPKRPPEASELLPPSDQPQPSHHLDPDVYTQVSKRSVALLNRPLSRMDIFYSGSIQNLPQFKSHQDVRHFLASTLSIPMACAAAAEESVGAGTVVGGVDSSDYDRGRLTGDVGPPEPESAKKGLQGTLRNMLDFSLFSSPTFIILAMSGFFTLTGFFVPFIYLPQMAVSFGHSPDRATFLVSVLGITNIVARIFCGWLSDRPQANALMINNGALIAAGLATAIVPHCQSYFMLCAYCVVFGTGTACFASLRSVICVELLGLEKLTNAFGLLLLFMGVASLIGSPLAGFLFDLTKTFNLSFYVMGAMVAFSGVLGLPLPYVNAWEKRRDGSSSLSTKKQNGVKIFDDKNDNFSSDNNPSIVVYSTTDGGSHGNIPETVREEEEDTVVKC